MLRLAPGVFRALSSARAATPAQPAAQLARRFGTGAAPRPLLRAPPARRIPGRRPQQQKQQKQQQSSFHSSNRARDAHKPPKDAQQQGTSGAAQEKPLGLSGRLKKLSKEYGWAAFGVYMSLSVLDFPFCFLLVRVVGTDKIGEIEHWVTSHVKAMIPQSVKDRWNAYQHALKEAEKEQLGSNEISQDVEMAGWGVEKAQAAHQSEASLGTQLALAYAIHKSFIFIRVPLTAAITPKIVSVLRSWGWKIGKQAAGKR